MTNPTPTPVQPDDSEQPARPSLAELVARAQNRSDTDPTWRTDYR